MTVRFAAPSEGDAQKLASGDYVMTLADITEAEPSAFEPGTERLKFVWKVDEITEIFQYPDEVAEGDEEQYERTLMANEHWMWVSNKMGPRATLRKWLTGMLGRAIATGETPPSPDQFIGKKYKITMNYEEYTIKATGQSGRKLTIVNIRPMDAARRGRPVAAAQSAESRPWDTGAGAVPGF